MSKKHFQTVMELICSFYYFVTVSSDDITQRARGLGQLFPRGGQADGGGGRRGGADHVAPALLAVAAKPDAAGRCRYLPQ